MAKKSSRSDSSKKTKSTRIKNRARDEEKIYHKSNKSQLPDQESIQTPTGQQLFPSSLERTGQNRESKTIWLKIKDNPVSSVIYFLLTILIPIVFFYANDIYPLVRPTPPMAGEFNVAIAPFTLRDSQGKEVTSQEGEKLATFVFQRLEASLVGISPGTIQVEVREPDKMKGIRGSTVEERAQAAAEIANRINAHVLIYGWIQSGENPEIYPEFFINYRGFAQADEIVGAHRLGDPLRVTLPFDETKLQDVENPALSARVNALSLIVIGLAYDSIDKLDLAISYYREAEAIKGWLENAGKDVLYLLQGNAFLRRASIEKEPMFLPDAEEAYDNALKINPGYPRALLGKGGVTYLRALGDPSDDKTDSVNMEELLEAEEYFLGILGMPSMPEGMNLQPKARFNLGQIYIVRAQLQGQDWLETAREEFGYVIKDYEAGNERIQEIAAQAYARIAAINRLEGKPEDAIVYYRKAIQISSPFYQAYYQARLAEVFAEQGKLNEAISALEEAREISEFNGDEEAANNYMRELTELQEKFR